MRRFTLLLIAFILITACNRVSGRSDDPLIYMPIIAKPLPQGSWHIIETNGLPTPRHENGFVRVGDQMVLLGGRGIKKVEVYDPATATWTQRTNPPLEMHHFQAVAYNDLVYIMGAWTGPFPFEETIDYIYMYDVSNDQWTMGDPLPAGRGRGSAGVAIYEDKFYMVGGAVGGHGPHATTVNWFDMYDPTTGIWTPLPDAPHARDHFHVAILDGKLYAVGGRVSGADAFQDQTIGEVDVYDLVNGGWTTLPPESDLPIERGGSLTAVLGNEIIVTGGEGYGLAWPQTQALNPDTGEWRDLAPLVQARHGTQIITCNGGLYTVAGAGAQGGVPELDTLEAFFLEEQLPCK